MSNKSDEKQDLRVVRTEETIYQRTRAKMQPMKNNLSAMKKNLPLAFISLLVLAGCAQKEKATASTTRPIASERNPALEQESEALKFSGEDRGDIWPVHHFETEIRSGCEASLYAEPHGKGEVIASLESGTRVLVTLVTGEVETVDGEENLWYHVLALDGTNAAGWVFGAYLEDTE